MPIVDGKLATEVLFEGGKVVMEGTKNTAVFIVKAAGQVLETIIHHAGGPGRSV